MPLAQTPRQDRRPIGTIAPITLAHGGERMDHLTNSSQGGCGHVGAAHAATPSLLARGRSFDKMTFERQGHHDVAA